jgi:hypothetical protein
VGLGFVNRHHNSAVGSHGCHLSCRSLYGPCVGSASVKHGYIGVHVVFYTRKLVYIQDIIIYLVLDHVVYFNHACETCIELRSI